MKTDTATQIDIDALTTLNREYIHSVQHGDVRRFDDLGRRLSVFEPRRVASRQEPVPCADRATSDDHWPRSTGCQSTHPRRCRDHPRADQLYHGRRNAAVWALHRRLGAPEREVACSISACDPIGETLSRTARISG